MTSIKDFSKRVFMTNKLMTTVAVVLIAFLVVLGGLFVAGWADKESKESRARVETTQPADSGQVVEDKADDPSQASNTSQYTLAQVAAHNTADDCWIVIEDSVYDVDRYLSEHPGGANAIIPYCGKDATTAFRAISGGRGHSNFADEIKANYKIGVFAR